ncbi:MAG TPA: hypothetical protein VFJ58_22125 [Armatimonadota bacterium]|nr:hypothetical protein [Armatimonadota bacterium]
MTAIATPSPLTRTSAAYHEAGHAFAFYKLGIDVESVTIEPDPTGRDGMCKPALNGHFIRQIIAALAGFAAYKLIMGNSDPQERERQAGVDYLEADYLARWFWTYRMLDNTGQSHASDETKIEMSYSLKVRTRADLLVTACEGLACRLIQEGREAVDALASALIDRGQLAGHEVAEIIHASMRGFQRDEDPQEIHLAGERLVETIEEALRITEQCGSDDLVPAPEGQSL